MSQCSHEWGHELWKSRESYIALNKKEWTNHIEKIRYGEGEKNIAREKKGEYWSRNFCAKIRKWRWEAMLLKTLVEYEILGVLYDARHTHKHIQLTYLSLKFYVFFKIFIDIFGGE